MGLHRNVLMPNGTVYGYHTVNGISHIANDKTRFEVISWPDEESAEARANGFQVVLEYDLDDTIGFDKAYERVSNEELYTEYIDPTQTALDEVLPILTDEQAEQVVDAFPAWQVGKAYEVGYRVRYQGALYKCVQAHTSQADWTPDAAPSLWSRVGEGNIPEWIQPTGAHDAYAMGDKVRHNGKVWTSDIDANVYEPGVYGWSLS